MPPIDLASEHLLPLHDLPDYLASRGFGKKVSRRDVHRWVRRGVHGARLDVVAIDGTTLTSVEAVQRWVEAQTTANERPGATSTASTRSSATPPDAPVTPRSTPEHQTSMHLLTEHRVMPTELDRLVHSLNHPKSTKAFAAGVLFRTGLRTPADAREKGLDQLLRIEGLGSKSREVVRSLWKALSND